MPSTKRCKHCGDTLARHVVGEDRPYCRTGVTTNYFTPRPPGMKVTVVGPCIECGLPRFKHARAAGGLYRCPGQRNTLFSCADVAVPLKTQTTRSPWNEYDDVKKYAAMLGESMNEFSRAAQYERVERLRALELSREYGYCPVCGDACAARERRPDGDDTCVNGHTYPSAAATSWDAAKKLLSPYLGGTRCPI
jgi:hypothetical protein